MSISFRFKALDDMPHMPPHPMPVKLQMLRTTIDAWRRPFKDGSNDPTLPDKVTVSIVNNNELSITVPDLATARIFANHMKREYEAPFNQEIIASAGVYMLTSRGFRKLFQKLVNIHLKRVYLSCIKAIEEEERRLAQEEAERHKEEERQKLIAAVPLPEPEETLPPITNYGRKRALMRQKRRDEPEE